MIRFNLKSLKTVIIGWLMIASYAQAAELKNDAPTLIPRDLLFGNPEKASPKISPDGTKLAFVAPDQKNVLNVWVRNPNQKESDTLVTSDQKRGVRQFLWQKDSQHILYVQDQDGDENWHLYQTNIDSKKTRDLTPFEGARADIIAYEAAYPDLVLVQINNRDKGLFDVYQINLKTGESELKALNPGGIFSWEADNNLKIRAALSYTQEGATLIRVRENEKDEWKELMTIDPQEISEGIVGFTPDNKSFYLLASLDGNTARLLEVDAITGKRKLVIEDPQFDLSSVLRHPTKHTLEAVRINRELHEWIVLDPSLQADFDVLKKTYGEAFNIVSVDKQNQKWVIAALSDRHPTRFYLYNRETKTGEFLFTTQPALEKYTLSAMEPVSFTARDGMKIYGYLTLPVGKKAESLPTVLLVHGGPWVRDSWGLSPTVQWLSNRGYAVFQINYRGSTGYGKQYLNAGNREWANKMHDDLLDGKQWLIQKGYSDPKKVAIYGGSYGGYATLVGLAFTPDQFCCGVDIVGPSNLITLLKTIPAYWGPLKAQTEKRIGKSEEEDFLKSRSPLFKADRIQRPLLIAQGANDPRVKQSESDQIVQAMRAKGLPVEYLLFQDEGHGFVRPENALKFSAAAEHFLAEYLGGRSQAPSAEENWNALKK